MFFHFRRRRPEVRDISYDPGSAMLKAYTTAKRAEVGILYLGMRLRNYYLEKTLAGPTPAFLVQYKDLRERKATQSKMDG